MTDDWVSLFSGGKDSSWALYRALQEGLNVTRLLTVHPRGDSYMYHVPATELARLAAESIGIELLEVDPGELDAEGAIDSAKQGDAEVQPLEAALREVAGDIDLGGVTAGAIESRFQTDRIERMCDRLGIDLYAPLWQRDPERVAEEMLAAGFEITIVQVAAYGLDESWLGRTLDAAAIDDLRDLHEEYGVHILGEGGEFETIVTDGPHMDRPIELTAEPAFDDAAGRGRLRIIDARLG
ncbi:MAG: diphthine--ammonia ligase [Halobacteriota archaeon]